MSSLYRCRARVGYRPAGSEQLIVFEERQIQELNVKLKWQPNAAFASADRSTEASVATNGLGQSTCSVTISDPYLTGAAWPALFDAAQLYTQSNISAANNILLPPCGEGEDPNVDKCFKYVDTESDNTTDQGGKFPFLLLSLWYDVKGTSFGTDFYFRVNGFSVSHGTKYPSVTIRGAEVRSVLFNQSLVNMTLDEGVDIDKALKDLAESMGYSASFCANTNADPAKKRILPRSVRYTGITTDEAIKKVLNSVNGNSHSMPTREYANKISMCSRGEITQGCSVFYLGRGLYEGYELTGQPELTALALNSEFASNTNNADPYVSEAFKSSSYFIGDVAPKTRKKAMEKVKKPAFPKLFDPVPKHIKGAPTTTGYVWKGKGPDVINEEATKLQKDGMNLFGVAPNGTSAISFLSGEVVEANNEQGRVDIKTTFSLHVCEKKGSEKCFYRPIRQESTGLSSVKVKAKDKLTISQEIGTSTAEKPEFVRFYILGHNGARTTLDPQLVWDWAFSQTEIPKTRTPAVNSGTPQQRATPQNTSESGFVGRVGSTGSSKGPHLHAELGPFTNAGGRGQPVQSSDVDPYVLIGGKPASAWGVYSPYGPRSSGFHYGIDFSGPGPGGQNINGQPVSITGGATVVESGRRGGYGNTVIIKRPDGKEMILAHLQDNSIPPNIAGLTTSSGGGKNNPSIQGSPTANGLNVETSFKGVPRALRIIPGRTILSFVTDYDAWVEGRRPATTDPGVWIAGRFKNWFVNECDYKWRDGDLRVQIEGVSAWGTTQITVPTFDNYLKGLKDAGDIKITSTYYDYIRSIGGLSWKIDGKDSTEVNCPESQQLSAALSQGPNSTDPSATDTRGSYPAANCKTGDAAKDAIINALYSAGLKTPNAFAGALGNIQEESQFNPNIHNTSIQGVTCVTDSGVPEKCYGLVQWGGSRKTQAIAKCGQTSTLQCQLEFVVQEIKQRGGGLVEGMNSSRTASAAAEIWRRKYEVASGKIAKRQQFAEQIVKQITCS